MPVTRIVTNTGLSAVSEFSSENCQCYMRLLLRDAMVVIDLEIAGESVMQLTDWLIWGVFSQCPHAE